MDLNWTEPESDSALFNKLSSNFFDLLTYFPITLPFNLFKGFSGNSANHMTTGCLSFSWVFLN